MALSLNRRSSSSDSSRKATRPSARTNRTTRSKVRKYEPAATSSAGNSRRRSARTMTSSKKGFSFSLKLPSFSRKKKLETLASKRRNAAMSQNKTTRRMILAAGSIVAAIFVLGLALFIVSLTPAFTITQIKADPTTHLTAEEITKIADVTKGTTLLNINTAKVENNIKRNPWVASVSVTRQFPSTLHLTIHERQVKAVVLMGAQNTAWIMGTDGVWIQPAKLDTPPDGKTSKDMALELARKMNCYLIYGVADTTEPVAGQKVNVAAIDAAFEYIKSFSPEFKKQIIAFSAQSKEALSITTESGVEISLGNPNNIAEKERVIVALLEKHKNQITYINVRNASSPTYRKVSSDDVKQGSGVSGKATEDTKSKGKSSGKDSSKDSEGSKDQGSSQN